MKEQVWSEGSSGSWPDFKGWCRKGQTKTVVNKDLRDVEENTSQPFRQAVSKINPAQLEQTNKLPANKEDPESIM